jgi:hypothetical protein
MRSTMNDRYVKRAALVILVFMVKNKGAPVSRDVPPREAP